MTKYKLIFYHLHPPGSRFEPSTSDKNTYKVVMKLTIKSIEINDFGTYRCVAKNSLGDTDGSIKLYRKYEHFVAKMMINELGDLISSLLSHILLNIF